MLYFGCNGQGKIGYIAILAKHLMSDNCFRINVNDKQITQLFLSLFFVILNLKYIIYVINVACNSYVTVRII